MGDAGINIAASKKRSCRRKNISERGPGQNLEDYPIRREGERGTEAISRLPGKNRFFTYPDFIQMCF